jgi:hypothetical protein
MSTSNINNYIQINVYVVLSRQLPTYVGNKIVQKSWFLLDKCSKKRLFQFLYFILNFGKLHKVFMCCFLIFAFKY